jgi:molecular chaperone DnaK (HSP70)
MAGRLAVDFGTSNTLLSVWNEARQEGIPVIIPDFSRVTNQNEEEIGIIPSLIHYTPDGRRWIGEQVLQRGLYNSRCTFRWMKRYIGNRSPIRIRVGDQSITPFQAGKDFLTTLLFNAREQLKIGGEEEIGISVPVEAFEHYENWLATVAEAAGMPRFRLIDEPSAAALGYTAHIQPGNVYMIFDFGGGTLHASIVLIEAEERGLTGKRCRVLGKAGRTIGGATIDQWIYQDVLQRTGLTENDERALALSNTLLVNCEQIKETLSFSESAHLHVLADDGFLIQTDYSRTQFEDLLDRHNLFTDIAQTIRAALNAARERGYDESAVLGVFMVGGSSQIPSVQRAVRQVFGRERIHHHRPLDAIVRGVAAFVAGADFYDHIQHDYAIRYVDPAQGDYNYRTIVQQGTPYPTREPLARLAIKASYEGQEQLGLAIFEMGGRIEPSGEPLELVFDPAGAARVIQVTPHEQQQRERFWMNEANPTFLHTSVPGRRGEAQFEVEFHIDANKRLVINARDLKSGALIHNNYPVIRLT